MDGSTITAENKNNKTHLNELGTTTKPTTYGDYKILILSI